MTGKETDEAVDKALAMTEDDSDLEEFSATVKVGNKQARVHIYHHETHPSGGQTFTADVTELPSGQHAGRRRIHRP